MIVNLYKTIVDSQIALFTLATIARHAQNMNERSDCAFKPCHTIASLYKTIADTQIALFTLATIARHAQNMNERSDCAFSVGEIHSLGRLILEAYAERIFSRIITST